MLIQFTEALYVALGGDELRRKYVLHDFLLFQARSWSYFFTESFGQIDVFHAYLLKVFNYAYPDCNGGLTTKTSYIHRISQPIL